MNAYCDSLADAIKRGAVDVTITKCVTLGPPEAGKTQLKRALLGDFTEANESTSVSTQAIPAVDIYASGQGNWVQLDMRQLKGAIQSTASEKGLQSKIKRNEKNEKSKAVVMTHQEKHLHKIPSVSVPSDVEDQTNKSTSKDGAEHKWKIIDMKEHEKSLSKKFLILKNEVESAFVNVETPSASTNLHRAHLLYMVDNGGQPSFQDFHSAVATFPAIHFLVYNMKEGLNAQPKMTYRRKAFPTKKLANSTLSNFAIIHRLLLTIHHFGPRVSRIQAGIKDLMKDEFRAFQSNPPVFIVGTHIGKKESFEKDGNKLSSLLQSIPSLERIGETHFVNSLDPSCSGIKDLQQSLRSNSTSCSFRLPLSWFYLQLMCLALDAEEIPDLSLQIQAFVDLRNRCLEENLVASHEEFEAMIRVFHSLGVFSCPDLELSNEVESWYVFTSPNLLYSMVTKILDIPLRDVTIFNKPLLDLQATGEISSEGLSALGVPDTLGSCQGFHKRLLKWLVHWGLAAEMVGGRTWFIPSILPPRSEVFHSPFVESPFNPFPLSICFLENSSDNLTFHYLPEGFFPHFVVNLVKNGYTLSPNHREGANLSRCRDAVFLIKRNTSTVNPMNTFNIWLLDEATHLSVYMSPAGGSSAPSAHQEAGAVLAELKDKVEETNCSLYYRSNDNIAICCSCPCRTMEGEAKASKLDTSHLAQVTYDHKFSRAKIFCLDPGRLACWERHVSKDEQVEHCNFLPLIMESSHPDCPHGKAISYICTV